MKESNLWFLFIAAGAIILVLLGIHMAIMHMESLLAFIGIGYKHVLSSESVGMRSKMLHHVILYMLLLATALFHGLYGFRSIVYELPINVFLKRFTDIVVTLAGFLFFFWGAAAIIIGYLPK